MPHARGQPAPRPHVCGCGPLGFSGPNGATWGMDEPSLLGTLFTVRVSLTGPHDTQILGQTLFCEGISEWDEYFTINMNISEKGMLSSPVWVGLIWSLEGLNRTRRQSKNSFLSPSKRLWAGTSVFSCLWTQSWTGIYMIDSPPSQAFKLWLDYTIGPCGFPACWLKILGLLSFHNCVKQFLIIYRYGYKIEIEIKKYFYSLGYWFYFSGEPKQINLLSPEFLNFRTVRKPKQGSF